MSKFTGIGVMSGTSLDGLDILCCEFDSEQEQYQFTILARKHLAYDEKWKSRLTHLMFQNAEVYAKTHVYYGHFLGKAIRKFVQEHHLSPDYVAVHGHTIFHQPQKTFTAQIGDGETISAYLLCPLVTNFRNKDVAVGGEGAPLVPLGEKYLFPNYDLFLNLGGFCNLSVDHLAFDVAPCNNVLNMIAREYQSDWEYDPEGTMAASGTLSIELLDELNDLSFYQKAPPKSLGWEWVQEQVIPILRQTELNLPDIAHTFVIHIVQQLQRALGAYNISGKKILVSGGGRHNRFFMDKLESQLLELGIRVEPLDQDIIDYKEAIIFAFLGLRVLEGKTTVLSSATGAKRNILTGSVHLPPLGGYRITRNI